ncbi:hypothetical protein SKAU_G00200900 [Synaphobranchus kaupii]|uniref:Uncharacterized protein n=1 Tax=Synaphobranchus kaupii TaxID=118154 RepID=A0A9Q1IXU5_SYNKA|nr:hypothetical protein SKAU_G00200900 [Synaphobranchus kaupii]
MVAVFRIQLHQPTVTGIPFTPYKNPTEDTIIVDHIATDQDPRQPHQTGLQLHPDPSLNLSTPSLWLHELILAKSSKDQLRIFANIKLVIHWCS